MKPKLTPKQQRFVDEYLINLNATQAAIKAGYSAKTAYAIGNENLSKPEIVAAISKAKAKRAAKTEITAERVLEELGRIAFANAGDFFNWGPDGITIRDKGDLTREQQSIVAEVAQTTTKYGGSVRVKLHDKMAALNLLAKHTGVDPNKVKLGIDPDDPLAALIKAAQGTALKPVADPSTEGGQ